MEKVQYMGMKKIRDMSPAIRKYHGWNQEEQSQKK
jgi:hypothetical protein